MRHVVVGAQQAALFGGEDDEQQRTLRLHRVQREGAGQFHHADSAGAVVVGAVQNAQRADAIVIEVAAEDHGLRAECGVAAFQQARHVVGIGAAAFAQHGMQFDARVRQGEGHRARTGVDRGLHVGGFPAGGREEAAAICAEMVNVGIADRLRPALRWGCAGGLRLRLRPAASAASRATGVIVRIGHRENADRAVALGVERLVGGVGVARVALAVEDRLVVVLLRLVAEDQDHFARDVESGVIVVAEFGSADAVAGEDHGPGDRDLIGEVRRGIRRVVTSRSCRRGAPPERSGPGPR